MGWCTTYVMKFFTLDSSNIEVFKTYFFDIVITPNERPRCVKQVLGCSYVFFTLFGYWVPVGGGGGGSPKGLVRNLLMQFFTLGCPNIEVFDSYFFDTMIT